MNTAMNPLSILFTLLLLITSHAHSKPHCRRTFRLTEKFCDNVPTAKIDLHAFSGTWFQIFVTKGNDQFQLNKCATVQYLLQPDGKIDGLECEFDDFLPRPRCNRDDIIQKPDAGPGSLLVVEGSERLPINVVTLLGSKSYGYFAAALFQCNQGPGRRRTPGYFIISRKPIFQRKVLRRLKKKLRCLGFPLPKAKDFRFTQVKGCQYFFDKDGFDVLSLEDFLP